MIIGIDPGSEQSAYVIWDGIAIYDKGIVDNETMLNLLRSRTEGRAIEKGIPKGNELVIEQVRSYGMAVGASTFDTVHWSGRFEEAWYPRKCTLMPRMDVKMHLCHTSRAKDTNINAALKDRFGKIGTVKNPNLTYGEEKGSKDSKMKSHLWAAFAIAVTEYDKKQAKN